MQKMKGPGRKLDLKAVFQPPGDSPHSRSSASPPSPSQADLTLSSAAGASAEDYADLHDVKIVQM